MGELLQSCVYIMKELCRLSEKLYICNKVISFWDFLDFGTLNK